MIVEYPLTLPPPLSGSSVSPTERRKISNIPGPANYRTVQRDYGGTKTVSFVFTPEQSEEFRFWWEDVLEYGGGWFAANWPLLQSRTNNVFKFISPPVWSLVGGGIDGLGYWRVSAELEIRGRGELPELQALILTSWPYPVYYQDDLEAGGTARLSNTIDYFEAIATAADITSLEVIETKYTTLLLPSEDLSASATVTTLTFTGTVFRTLVLPAEAVNAAGNITAFSGWIGLIVYDRYPPEALNASATITNLTRS